MNSSKVLTIKLIDGDGYKQKSQFSNSDWNIEELDYEPVYYTAKVVLDNDICKKPNGWADPAEITPEFSKELSERVSYTTGKKLTLDYELFGKMLPRNPKGRTGICGRGLLGKYGPNFAADPLVTRYNENGSLEMVAILRDDVLEWAIPGGMVEEGEEVSLTLKREFNEEAKNCENSVDILKKLDDLFSNGVLVFSGYVSDPRNTDNAWMETTCVHFHIDDEDLAKNLKLEAGSDAAKVKWVTITDDLKLYASHKDMVDLAVKNFKKSVVV